MRKQDKIIQKHTITEEKPEKKLLNTSYFHFSNDEHRTCCETGFYIMMLILLVEHPDVGINSTNTLLLYSSSCFIHLNTNIWTFSSHFQNRLVTLVWRIWGELLIICYLASLTVQQKSSWLESLQILIFSLCCCSGSFTNPRCVHLMCWERDSTINCLCGAFRNSWDKSYWFCL